MGQKVNPHGLRVGVIKDWDSRWYARDEKVGDLIVEDYKIREYLKKTLYSAGIPNIEIERDSAKVRIYIHCSRPGVVIGKGGAEIERIRLNVEKMIGKPVALSIVEVRTPDTNAQLVAENIAAQLEKRIGFRRAMKNAMGRAMRMGARGIKIMCSGRLGGAEIARTECYHEGTIPLQTIRADIEYGFAEAATTYGRVGVKVWIYKGEILSQSVASVSPFDYYDTLAQSAKAMSALFRDDLAQKGGNTYTWKLNNAVLNGLLGVTDDNGITDGALEDTMVLDGFLTTDTKGNATVQLSMDLKTGDQPQERIGLRFRLTQSTSTTSTLPSLTLPEGADVQEFMGVGSVL